MPPQDSAQQKTEKPTRRRREKARAEGTVAHSGEVQNVFVLIAGVGALSLFGGKMFACIVAEVAGRLGGLGAPELSMDGACQIVSDSVGKLAAAVMPIMIFIGVVGLCTSLAQTGIVFAPKQIVPDLSRVNPVKGVKNIVSLSGLVRFLVAVVKLTLISLIAFFFIRSHIHVFPALMGKSAWGAFNVAQQLCLSLLIWIMTAMVVVAVADFGYQRWKHEKELMMTRSELKEERKREDGSPEVRARQKQVRRELARKRMIQAVPTADVVVTNPTQVAVALKWDDKAMSAPQVVAKGKNLLAEKIRQVACEHGVAILERKNLARALYEAVEVGMEIPANLYYAVAEVLAFVMGQKVQHGRA